MTAETVYLFLKGPLSQMDVKERRKLCRLISDEAKKRKPKKQESVPSVDWYKKQLLKSFFQK